MSSIKRRYQIRILASALLIVLSLSMLVMVTFAWYVMSTAPEVSGMQIKIGSDTIQVAPDCTDTTGQHYPGTFQGALEVQENTSLLENFWGLIPVSTADGKHWFSATYQPLEQGGEQVEDTYLEDTILQYANRTTRPQSGGNYLYLDFWVVSPKDYDLRVSTADQGSDQSGSYVKVFPQVTEENGTFALDESQRQAEASVRIGFLVNEDAVSSERYKQSEGYDSAYKILRGNYQEPGYRPDDSETQFTIYEPNCDWHVQTQENGKYLQTQPLAWKDGKVQSVTLESAGVRVAAQTQSTWTKTEDNSQSRLARDLEMALLDAKVSKKDITDAKSAQEYLMTRFIQGETTGYISSGRFIENSNSLQNEAATADMAQAGAAADAAIVSLKKNVPQRIRMFVWLEGQDTDCTNEAALKTLLINLELAGESKK